MISNLRFLTQIVNRKITPNLELGSVPSHPNIFRHTCFFSNAVCNSLSVCIRTSQSQDMSKHFGQPLKVFGECYPNNIYYDQWENGTYFKSRGYFQLWQFESKIANGIEIVTEISSSNQTHPIVSCTL